MFNLPLTKSSQDRQRLQNSDEEQSNIVIIGS